MKILLLIFIYCTVSALACECDVLGSAAHEEISEENLKAEQFEGVKLVHMRGFYLANGSYMEKAMELAQASGAKISLDLANAELIKKFRERILAFLDTYTDILFINENEAFVLTQLPPEKSARYLNNFCPIVVIKVGEKGCWVSTKEGLFHSPGLETAVIDTTGVGDLFVNAFLCAYLEGHPLEACAYFANIAASASVETFGTELPKAKWAEIRYLMDGCDPAIHSSP